jgi:hypothetical protein
MSKLKVLSNITTHSSSKTITIPDHEQWDISAIYVTLASTATAGNRQLRLSILKPDNTVIFSTDALNTQAASLTYKYLFMPGAANEDHQAKLWLQNGLPTPCLVSAKYKIKIEDTAAVAAAADDMLIHIQYQNKGLFGS